MKVIFLIVSVIFKFIRSKEVVKDARLIAFEPNLISADKIFYTKNDFIHLAFTLTNILGEKKKIQDNITIEFQMWDKKIKTNGSV